MTDEELKAAVEKLKDGPFFYADGTIAAHARIMIALYDRIERQQEEIDSLRELVTPSVT